MSLLDIFKGIFTLIAYAGFGIFIVGFLLRLFLFSKTPAPLKIALTPAPTSSGGVISRMFQEVVLFKSLFKSNKVIWVAGYIFHFGLFTAFLKHLRFFFMSTPSIIESFTAYEMFAGVIMIFGLVFLLGLRLAIDRHYYISLMTDYYLLILLIAIGVTGITMKYFVRQDIIAIKRFMVGIMSLRPQAVPTDAVFIIHFSLVILLLVYFPFSKLMHAGGIFFSPTRNQIDNPREAKHVTPWATPVGGEGME